MPVSDHPRGVILTPRPAESLLSQTQQNSRNPTQPRQSQLHHVLERPLTRVHRLQPIRIRLLETGAEGWVGVREESLLGDQKARLHFTRL
jgi:hypothetical protein